MWENQNRKYGKTQRVKCVAEKQGIFRSRDVFALCLKFWAFRWTVYRSSHFTWYLLCSPVSYTYSTWFTRRRKRTYSATNCGMWFRSTDLDSYYSRCGYGVVWSPVVWSSMIISAYSQTLTSNVGFSLYFEHGESLFQLSGTSHRRHIRQDVVIFRVNSRNGLSRNLFSTDPNSNSQFRYFPWIALPLTLTPTLT